MRGKKMSQAMAFIVLFGIVSLFSDMTHEGASSIRGAYLALLGASAGTIGFISGLGELVGYSMRYVFGKLTDKSKHYWPMTIAGYVLDVLAVPALALVAIASDNFHQLRASVWARRCGLEAESLGCASWWPLGPGYWAREAVAVVVLEVGSLL